MGEQSMQATAVGETTRPRLLVVAGASRSGTTMLARMLSRHSLITGKNELHYFDQLRSRGSKSAVESRDLAGLLQHRATCGYVQPFKPSVHAEDIDAIVPTIPAAATTDEIYDAVLSHLGRGGLHWVIDKSPSYVGQLDDILTAFPDARVVLITRDPRDVLTSEKYFYRHFWATRAEVPRRLVVRHYLQYHPVTMSLLWRTAARTALAATDERIYTVAFEDVIADPQAVLTKVVEWIGEPYEPGMASVDRLGSSNLPGKRTGSGVDPSVQGRWQTGLNRTELWILDRITRQTMIDAGYKMDPPRPSPFVLVWLAVTLVARMTAAAMINPRRGVVLVRQASASLRRTRSQSNG